MNKNQIGLALGVVALVGLGLWFAYQPEKEEIEEAAVSQTLTGTVTAVNLEEMMVDGPGRITFKTADGAERQIALPSMGRNLCKAKDSVASPDAAAIGDTIEVRGEVGEDGAIVPCMDESHYFRVEGTYTDAKLGLTFTYPKGQGGYALEARNAAATDKNLVRTLVLLRSEDVQRGMPVNGEGPPALTVSVLKNTQKQRPQAWADTHVQYSNINLKQGAVAETTLAGANAIRYSADGLYPSTNVVVAHGSYVYVFTGAYLDETSPQKADFEDLLASVAFIPETP